MDKSAALGKLQPPTTIKALKSFLGLANYFRPYLKHFATTAAHLFKLTRKDSPWSGGPLPEEALEAFLDIQAKLSDRPVMAYPRKDGEYHLFVDAALGDARNEG
jgi:hypothetical protein